VGGPNEITRSKDGNFYVVEREDDDETAYVHVRDANRTVSAHTESRHVHDVDSKGDFCAGLTQNRSVDKFVYGLSADAVLAGAGIPIVTDRTVIFVGDPY